MSRRMRKSFHLPSFAPERVAEAGSRKTFMPPPAVPGERGERRPYFTILSASGAFEPLS